VTENATDKSSETKKEKRYYTLERLIEEDCAARSNFWI